jgi:outer membrane protein assembly factor BamB
VNIWPTIGRAAPLLALFALAGCGETWLGGDEEGKPLPGERISVLVLERALEPDPALATETVRLPRPFVNPAWPVPGGTPAHALHHLDVGDSLAVAWQRRVGEGETDDNLILSPPVVADGRVFLLDAESTVVALSLADGSSAWRRELIPEDEDDEASLGGGVAYANGIVYATTAFGNVVAMAAADGSNVWSFKVGVPLRAAPAVADGRVFVNTFDNRLYALDAGNGSLLWTHEGIGESAGLLGSAVPAVSGDLVVASFSSGEVVALRVENGRLAWSDSLIFQGRLGSRTNLSDIDADPVIDRGLVIVVSQSGRLVAIDLRSGLRNWEREVPSAQTPWVAGDYLYVVTTDAQVACLRRSDGGIRWVTGLPRYSDPEDRKGPIVWSGPVLAGNRLVVVGSDGDAVAISPYNGEVLGRQPLPEGVRVSPVVAERTLYLLTMGADLLALR